MTSFSDVIVGQTKGAAASVADAAKRAAKKRAEQEGLTTEGIKEQAVAAGREAKEKVVEEPNPD